MGHFCHSSDDLGLCFLFSDSTGDEKWVGTILHMAIAFGITQKWWAKINNRW
jgi:hypothetical protein